MKLIVGLGNPGLKYEKTRHNVGFMLIDEICNYFGLKCNKTKFFGLYAEFIYKGKKVIFLKPQKYMNLSGEVLKDFIDYYKIKIENILIIYDELDIELGKFKIKPQGRANGHNGLKNIETNLKTNKYKRIKIGISKDELINPRDYVLGKLNLIEFEPVKKRIPHLIEDYLNLSFSNLMNKYNIKGD